MKTSTEFDLRNFQSEVFNDFNNLKATMAVALFHSKGYGTPEKFKEIAGEPDLKIGFVMEKVLKFFSFLGKKAKKDILETPDFLERKRKAAKIAGNPKIKKLLCRALKKEISPDLFTEAKMVRIVKIVTTLLTKEELTEKFSIEKDVRVFSLIAIKIYRDGTANYCG